MRSWTASTPAYAPGHGRDGLVPTQSSSGGTKAIHDGTHYEHPLYRDNPPDSVVPTTHLEVVEEHSLNYECRHPVTGETVVVDKLHVCDPADTYNTGRVTRWDYIDLKNGLWPETEGSDD